MWTTGGSRPTRCPLGEPAARIRRITNAFTSEPLIPQRGRLAALSILVEHLPADCDLNNLQVLADGEPGAGIYIGPLDSKGSSKSTPGFPTASAPVWCRWSCAA